MERIVKKISLAYYLIYTLTILSTIIGYMTTMNSQNTVDIKSNFSITISSIVILYIIVSVPGALALFHRYVKKINETDDQFTKINKYAKAAIWRLLAVGFGLIFSVVAFYIIRTESMIFCAGIAAIALLFCKPTESKIYSDLKTENEE
jgi:heme/copper-type cytochrome/quinol oxidase subunit 2